MKNIKKLITKAGIHSVLATILDYYSGRYSKPTALKFGIANFISTGAFGYLEYLDENKDKSIRFLQARTLETFSSILFSKLIDNSSWDNKISNYSWDVIKYNNLDKRILIILFSNVISGSITSWADI